MPLTRTPHWATREYHQFLLARARAPFAWGVNDCCLFPADAIRAFTGVDIAADFRGKYSDEASAMGLIKTITGGSTVADAAAWCAAKHGLAEWVRPKGPLFARRGDLAVLEDAGRLIAGVVHLNGRDIVTVGERGLKRLPLLGVLRAWAV